LFELANTRFINQLKSVANLAPVKQTTGGVHEALWSTVPALGPGQCLISGAVFKNPIFVNIRPARSRRLLTGWCRRRCGWVHPPLAAQQSKRKRCPEAEKNRHWVGFIDTLRGSILTLFEKRSDMLVTDSVLDPL
jgi:hypothetical protein